MVLVTSRHVSRRLDRTLQPIEGGQRLKAVLYSNCLGMEACSSRR
jgi:hypothetical protein